MKRTSRRSRSKAPVPVESESESDSESDSENCVKKIGTSIYFYSDVTRKSVMRLLEKYRELEIVLLKKSHELPGYTPEITLFINSEGGDVYAGLSAMDHILTSKVKTITVADGCCASAATFILLGGQKRMITKHAHVLIHQISTSGFWGKFEELKDEVELCNKLMETLKSVYTEKTEIPTKKYKTLMRRDVYLSAEECLEYQIVDEIFCL